MSAQQDGGGSSETLSIEETNKLRASLGLKPLEVEDASGNDAGKEGRDVHVPAESISDKHRAAKMQEKIERVKKMRKLHKKLGSVKTLGEADGEDDVTSWLSKSRKQDEEKKKAEQRQRELDAMDDDFGVSALLEEESNRNLGRKGKGVRGDAYSSSDLTGLTVEHDEDAFMDGDTTILTLKDKGVLEEEDGDVLVNVNLLDLEKAKKSRENKKRKPDYRPWEEEEFDENGMPREKKVLSKYDEEIEGQERKSFKLGDGGSADLSDKMVMEMIKNDMRERAQTLDYSKGELAREYYTNSEMASFKKPKKKRKVMKKKMLKADDLLRMDPDDAEPEQDTSSRKRESSRKPAPAPVAIKQEPKDDNNKLSDEEEDDAELRIALARTRRLRQMERRRSPSPILAEPEVKMEVDSDADEAVETTKQVSFGSAFMSTTSEFCRTVGTDSSPTRKKSSVTVESDDDDMDIDDEDAPAAADDAAAGWSQVDLKQKKKDKQSATQEVEDSYILEAEPIVSSSLAACLQMADQKGFLEQQKSKDELRKGVSLQLIGSAAELDAKARDRAGELRDRERRDRDRDRDRYDRDYDRDRNPLDKSGYKPNVKLEYVDDSGRLLDQKGAFRQLSWRFHGKTSGKMKTEKRKKKLEEEEKLLKMSSTDTPLATRALLEDKLKQTKSPFLVLSGSAQRSLTANNITKN